MLENNLSAFFDPQHLQESLWIMSATLLFAEKDMLIWPIDFLLGIYYHITALIEYKWFRTSQNNNIKANQTW